MLRRVDGLLRQLSAAGAVRARHRRWPAAPSGAGRSTRSPAACCACTATAIGLTPDFTILDRSDAEDLLDVVRTELGLAKTDKRFPRKGTCLAIYSHCVNAQRPIEDVLAAHYPWCRDYADELKAAVPRLRRTQGSGGTAGLR